MKFDELMENATIIANTYSDNDILTMSNELDYNERLKFDYKIRCIKENTTYQDNYADIYHKDEFVRRLIKNDELDYIVKNIDKIITISASLNDMPLSYLKRNMNKINKEDLEKIEIQIAKVASIHNSRDEDRIIILKDLLKKVAKDENKTLLDIRNLSHGCYSKVFKINNKIVKIGYKRECPDIPENNRILYPYFKGYIGADYVEVTDYVVGIGDATYEEMYEVYKDIRDEGLIWIDPAKENLARVSSDILYKNNQRRKDLTNKGIVNNPKHVPEIKDILVIDLDHITTEDDDYTIEKVRDKLSTERLVILDSFEERYRKETNKGITFKKSMSYDEPIYY